MTYQKKFEELRKNFAEKNEINEKAFDELSKKNSFSISNPLDHYIKTQKQFLRAGKKLYDFISYARKSKASPNDRFKYKAGAIIRYVAGNKSLKRV